MKAQKAFYNDKQKDGMFDYYDKWVEVTVISETPIDEAGDVYCLFRLPNKKLKETNKRNLYF